MKTPDKLEFDSFCKGDKNEKAIITIHGWKGNRTSFQQVCRSMNITNVKCYFPEAPYRVGEDERQRTWFIESSPGVWEIEKPRQLLDHFFAEHIWPVYSPENVYVMGFSQGAVVCYEFILQMDKTLGGIFPVAGFLPNLEDNRSRIHPALLQTDILVGHGRDDDIVPLSASRQAVDILKKQGANVRLLIYKGKHKIGLSYLEAMKTIIRNGKCAA